jgi:hypothetical protein
MRILLTIAVFAIALSAPLMQASAAQPREFQIVIENAKDGSIYVLENGQRLDIGKVLVPCGAVNDNGFTASMWGKNSTVTATAVNAMHIKVANSEATGRGIIFSLLPREFLNVKPEDYKSYLNRNASIFTDIPAGTAIFGGAHAPFNGCPVIVTPAGSPPEVVRALTPDYVPQEGDTLTISVRQETGIDYIEFDNSFGGFITEKRIGQEGASAQAILACSA